MRRKVTWRLFAAFSTLVLCLFYVTFSRNYDASKICSEKNPTTLSAEHSLAVSGWVSDCVTWNKKRQLQDITSHSFVLNRTLGVGESPENRQLFFHRIFAARDWPADDPSYIGLKASGPGSMLRNAQNVIAILHNVITRVRLHLGKSTVSLLDIPCGDLQWMPYVLETRPDVLYTGADIVPDIVSHHQKNYRRSSNVKFMVHDLVSAPLNHSYDIVLVRDLLQHLWLTDAMVALKRISDSGSKYLLVTTFPDILVNEDVDKKALGGRKSSYNLERFPFVLEAPVCTSYDWNVEHMSLWKLPLRQIRT